MKESMKYMGIGFQMFVIIMLGSWGSYKLNDYLGYEKPIITAIGAMLSIFVAMYFVFKGIRK